MSLFCVVFPVLMGDIPIFGRGLPYLCCFWAGFTWLVWFIPRMFVLKSHFCLAYPQVRWVWVRISPDRLAFLSTHIHTYPQSTVLMGWVSLSRDFHILLLKPVLFSICSSFFQYPMYPRLLHVAPPTPSKRPGTCWLPHPRLGNLPHIFSFPTLVHLPLEEIIPGKLFQKKYSGNYSWYPGFF